MTKGTRIDLPTHRFVISDPPMGEGQSIIQPGDNQYGGATVTYAVDAGGNEYVAFCGDDLATDEPFGFHIWNVTQQRRVPYSPYCTGRGSINGQGKWIAWKDKEYFKGDIQGFVKGAPQAGPAGPQGPQGPKGDPGPQGPPGVPGSGSGGDSLFEAVRVAIKAWLMR